MAPLLINPAPLDFDDRTYENHLKVLGELPGPPCVDGSWRVRSCSWKEIAGGRSNNSAGHDTVMSWLTGLTVIYIYRTSGEDDSVLPRKWDSIPGAHGCTPQSCSFRDHQNELAD